MHDNTLLAIALATSAAGIAGLLFCLIVLDVPGMSISEAKAADDGTALAVRGTVARIQERGGMTIITISQPTTIDVILDSNATAGKLEEGDCIVAQGKKGTYKESSQISASKIAKCKG